MEQTEPEVFYGALARDTIGILGQHTALDNATLLDVGCGPEQFAREFAARGVRYVGLDVDAHTVQAHPLASAVVGVGERLPFADASFDVVMSSNVMEHVRQPGLVADEMLRVAKPGGVVLISYTAWLSPWGGHETSPWHYLGGTRAAQRYEQRTGQPPKNRFGSTMFAAYVGPGVRWSRRQRQAEVLECVPRYHPSWASWVVAVPGLRELASWNLLLVLRKTSA